jgi:phosphotransferase system enzyme I (PtsI)
VVQHRSQAAKLEKLRDLPAETSDGVRIQLLGNIEFPYEVEQCQKRGADGIGLYRTEFLFMSEDAEPSESEQTAAYTAVAKALKDQPVVMRTIDLGADKLPSVPFPQDERNPSRTAEHRLLVKYPALFPLAARFCPSVASNISIMFPLVSTLRVDTPDGVAEAMEAWKEGAEFDRGIKVGI